MACPGMSCISYLFISIFAFLLIFSQGFGVTGICPATRALKGNMDFSEQCGHDNRVERAIHKVNHEEELFPLGGTLPVVLLPGKI